MPALIPVETDGRSAQQISQALQTTLTGGDPIAPLPAGETERAQALAMLRPDQPVTEPDAAVVVATSGSTGEPKGVVLTRGGIAASAESTHRRLGGPGDWLLALPTHYVAGLMVLARAVLAGTQVQPVGSDLRGLASLVRGAGSGRRRYLSVVPTQLVRALADQEISEALAQLDAVLIGGAAASTALLQRAREAGIAVHTTYGMSETCGGCVYDGVPLDGVEVTFAEPDPQGVGRIEIEGAPVFAGYRLRPELTAAALVPDISQTSVDASRRRFRTQDRGRSEDGRLVLLGRVDEVVVSGGLNVDLASVERSCRELALTGDAELVVIALPDAEWGNRVVAVTEASDLDPVEFRRRLGAVLPAHAVPRDLVRCDRLPRTAGGKVDRRLLVEELTTTPASAR